MIHATPWGDIQEAVPAHLQSDHATEFMLRYIHPDPGDVAAEPGCGSGVISLACRMAGAGCAIGTDIDEGAVKAAERNRRENRLDQVFFVRGNLLDSLKAPVDYIAALLPHKPAPRAFNHRYFGGNDGTDLIFRLISQAEFLMPPGGRLLLYLNSIANPKKVLDRLQRGFQVCQIAERKRYFTVSEFDSLTPGMFAHLEERSRLGEAEFCKDGQGLFFHARILEGVRR